MKLVIQLKSVSGGGGRKTVNSKNMLGEYSK